MYEVFLSYWNVTAYCVKRTSMNAAFVRRASNLAVGEYDSVIRLGDYDKQCE